MNETELRELLKLVRSIEHYIERCLTTEQEKNEAKIAKHLEAQGSKIVEEDKYCVLCPNQETKEICEDKNFCFKYGDKLDPSKNYPDGWIPILSPDIAKLYASEGFVF